MFHRPLGPFEFEFGRGSIISSMFFLSPELFRSVKSLESAVLTCRTYLHRAIIILNCL